MKVSKLPLEFSTLMFSKIMSSPEKEELSRAIIHYLRSLGIHVRPWKTSSRQENHTGASAARGLFGVPLQVLPFSEQVDGVPQFLVDACELLRPHLHVEGLFRKCGSMTRIKALKTRLEAGERCLEMALPCDVATLVKQFLRALPEPLIPARLQGPLCQVQQREDSEDNRGPLMLLVTSLLPQRSVDILRYLFNFLQDVAARCAQNKMDLSNLAVVFAPNLFPSEPCSQLNSQSEEQLRSQAAVLQVLITHASEIGIVPQSLLEKVQAAFSDLDHKSQPSPEPEEQRERDGEWWRRRRRRRRSMSNFVTETLSKFKTSRSLYPAPCQEIKTDSSTNPALRTSFNSKRKASEDVALATELSAKKRRSGLDSFSSDPFEDDAGDPFNQLVDRGSMQDPAPISFPPVFSSPVSDTRSRVLSPRSPAAKVQRKRSSGKKKHPQRKHSAQTSPSHPPSSFERKDTGRKSLRIFSRQTKDLAGEPSGWLLKKKMVTEAPEGPPSQQKWAQLQSYKLKESATGSPSKLAKENSYTPTSTKAVTPHGVVKCKNCKMSRPGFDGVFSGCQEMGLDGKFENREVLDKAEGLVGETRPLDLPAKHHRPLRRSLSWSEGLSMKNVVDETDFSPQEAPGRPGRCVACMFGLPDGTQPDVEVLVAGVRPLGIPAVCVTPVESCVFGCPENGPSHPLPSKPDLSDAHITLAERLRQLNEAPKSSLKRLTHNFQRASSQANEGPKVASLALPKHKGGRRFGRSISHESGLPLQGAQEVQSGHATKKAASVPSPRSPLQSFKAYGRQIFITRKHIMMSLAGLRGKREVPSPQGKEVPAVATPEP